MKKVGILTHYDVVNNGAVLQMYCLYHWLLEHNCSPTILTYQKNFDFAPEEAKKYELKLKNLPFFLKKYFIQYSPRVFFSKVKKTKLIKNFSKKEFVFEPYTTMLDGAVIGSDEVFSLEVGCNQMMYGHNLNARTVLSYAPSFGQTSLERIKLYDCEDIIKDGLTNKVKFLSVRDEKSFDLCKELTNRNDISIVCDPVILYNLDKVSVKHKKIKHKYILLYSYFKNMNSKEEISAIKSFAKQKGLKIASIGEFHSWCDINIMCDPLEWTTYFKEAEMVITDTFHGAVLSIVNQTKGLYFARNINSNKLTGLLKQFHLDEFLLKEVSLDELNRTSNLPYSKEKVLECVLRERKIGEEFLSKALEL